MKTICKKCGSRDVTITPDEVICNICDTTIDFRFTEPQNHDTKSVWAYDAQPVNLLREARMYNRQYHKAITISGVKHKKGVTHA